MVIMVVRSGCHGSIMVATMEVTVIAKQWWFFEIIERYYKKYEKYFRVENIF